MNFPNIEEINQADRIQICRWYRFLQANTESEFNCINRICERFKELGGFTPEISKQIGWKNV